MPQKVRIALDAMGGDHGASVVVPGAEMLADPASGQRIHPVRRQRHDSSRCWRRIRACAAAARVVHTDVAVRMDDKPSQALRHGRWKSSMWLAIDAVKKGEADVAVSAGNTGALMAMAQIQPAHHAGHRAAGDRGAVADAARRSRSCSMSAPSIGADAEHLVDLAAMGSAMARVLFDLERPTVGLLNIGVEEVKGLERCARPAASCARRNCRIIDYVGFVEGDDIGKGTVDVVVTEGFAGNIALKTAEGTARQIGGYLRAAMTPDLRARLGYLLARARVPHAAREDGPAQAPMAACFSASTASSSRAMAAPMRKASPRPSTSATTWCATNLLAKIERDHGANMRAHGAPPPRSGGAAS